MKHFDKRKTDLSLNLSYPFIFIMFFVFLNNKVQKCKLNSLVRETHFSGVTYFFPNLYLLFKSSFLNNLTAWVKGGKRYILSKGFFSFHFVPSMLQRNSIFAYFSFQFSIWEGMRLVFFYIFALLLLITVLR